MLLALRALVAIQIRPKPELPQHCVLCRVTDGLRSSWACACGAQIHHACAAEFELGACPTLGCKETLQAVRPKPQASWAPVDAARPAAAEAPIHAARPAGPEETLRHAAWRLVQWVLLCAVVPLLARAYYTKGYESYCDHVLHEHYRLANPGEFGLHVVLPAVLAELGSLAGLVVSLALLRRCSHRRAAEGETNSEEARKSVFGDRGGMLGLYVFFPAFVAWAATACCR